MRSSLERYEGELARELSCLTLCDILQFVTGIEIRFAQDADLPYLLARDDLVSTEVLKKKVADGQVIIVARGDTRLGWLRYGYLWDAVPFMNLIVVEESSRRHGIGQMLVEYWEQDLKARGYKLAMTSTDAHAEAQHFHRKMGYRDAGCLLLPDELFPEHTSELLLVKVLT